MLHLLFQVVTMHAQVSDLIGRQSIIRDQRDKQMIISVALIVVVFTICNCFESILFVLAYQGFLQRLDIFWNYLRPMANFLMVFNSSVNTFIYAICNTNFREEFFKMFINRCQSKPKHQLDIELPTLRTSK